mmetsp:Transcript_26186/g.63826  ORF Transcript_26186/g.63826 Transcript_26186/m.63826 type:complete len:176 (+) Transcript_26186:155-682(+)
MSRPRVSVGIQPQIAVYSIALGAACAYAAYNERYLRDQDDIETKLRDRYLANMQEAREKTPQLTQKIRGQDMNLDNAMNKLVWGGKAKLPETKSVAAVENDEGDDEEKKEKAEDSTREPKKRNKKRKKKKKKVDAAELEAREQEKKKLVLQSLAAGVTIGAAAVAATVLVGSKPK